MSSSKLAQLKRESWSREHPLACPRPTAAGDKLLPAHPRPAPPHPSFCGLTQLCSHVATFSPQVSLLTLCSACPKGARKHSPLLCGSRRCVSACAYVCVCVHMCVQVCACVCACTRVCVTRLRTSCPRRYFRGSTHPAFMAKGRTVSSVTPGTIPSYMSSCPLGTPSPPPPRSRPSQPFCSLPPGHHSPLTDFCSFLFSVL